MRSRGEWDIQQYREVRAGSCARAANTRSAHTCETALIAGDVDYDPEPLDPPAQGDAWSESS
jgi:hypothetical protein